MIKTVLNRGQLSPH